MKRPPGVPQAPRPAASREPEQPGRQSADMPAIQPASKPANKPVNKPVVRPGTKPAVTRAQKPAASRPGSAPARSDADAPTEPITLPTSPMIPTTPAPATAPIAPIAPTAPTGAGPKSLPSAGTPDTPGLIARLAARRAAGTPRGDASKTGDQAASPAAPLTARAARARLRAARRARKQYERSEVRRFTSRSRRRRNLWIAAGTTVAVLVAFVLVGVYSPLMALRTIEVTGTQRILPADIVAALDGQLDTPLPLLDFDEVKSELSQFSLIRSYVTESRPPDTLVVRIVEREPVGAVASAAGFDLVDAAGVVITSGADRPAGYPVIDAANGASGAGFPAAVAVIAALPEGIRSQLDTVTAATKDDVTLTLTGGARVVWGNSERAEYKAVVLAALLVSHPVGSVTEYDVTSPDSAVVR